MKKILLGTLAILAASAVFTARSIDRVKVQQGFIQGTTENGMGVFRAIPFAEAPVGELRWKAPVPKQPWDTVYVTRDFAPRPAQPGVGRDWSEDCLYLSVITPAKSPDEKLPVMVWIHGGAFVGGSYAYNQGWKFAERGVVVVSVEYRHGALGFLALPELTAESPDSISGNYGIMDQIMALKWVKENIGAFGGNPDNVTIFGESAGAISVSILCGSPAAHGLFHRAISESGGSFWPTGNDRSRVTLSDLKGAELKGKEFMEKMGASTLDELRQVDPQVWLDNPEFGRMEVFWPCVDGKVIAGDQYELYMQNRFNDVDIIVGTNSDEGSMFSHISSVEDYEKEVRETFGPFADRVLKAYPATTPEETFFGRADLFMETAFSWPSFAWENLHYSKSYKPAYVYYFDVPSDLPWIPIPSRGAPHAAEMQYVFGDILYHEPLPAQVTLSNMMTDYWTNFAKTGNPNGPGLPFWPLYIPDGRTVLEFNPEGTELIKMPNLERLQLMEEFFNWKRLNLKESNN